MGKVTSHLSMSLDGASPDRTCASVTAWATVGIGSMTDGIEAALERGHAAAGDRNVGIWGGANIIRQFLKAGLLDEIQIHLVPMLLGKGIRLFEDFDPEGIELSRRSSIETPAATHFRFRGGEATRVAPNVALSARPVDATDTVAIGPTHPERPGSE